MDGWTGGWDQGAQLGLEIWKFHPQHCRRIIGFLSHFTKLSQALELKSLSSTLHCPLSLCAFVLSLSLHSSRPHADHPHHPFYNGAGAEQSRGETAMHHTPASATTHFTKIEQGQRGGETTEHYLRQWRNFQEMKKNVGLKSVRDRVEWFLVDFSWGKCGMRFG